MKVTREMLEAKEAWPGLIDYCEEHKLFGKTPEEIINYLHESKDCHDYSWCIFKTFKLTGIDRGWYENGQLWYEDNFKDGKLQELSRSWYDNGQLWDECTFKDGEIIS